jgi:hypothetical protein
MAQGREAGIAGGEGSVKCNGECLKWRGGGLTSLMEGVIRDEERFLHGRRSLRYDRVNVI